MSSPNVQPSVEESIHLEVQPLVERACAFRKYITKWLKPLEDSNVSRFVTLPQETFSGETLRHSSNVFKQQFNSILADAALDSTQLPAQVAGRVADFDRSWKEAQKSMLLRLKGIKEEYPPLIASLKPLVDVAKRVDGLLNKIRKEEEKFDKTNFFGQRKTVDLTKLDQLKGETSEAVIEMENLKDAVKADLQNFIGKEHEVTEMLCNLIELQREHLTKTADVLRDNLDGLRQKVRTNPNLAVYKVPLQHHLLATKREIAAPIEVCCSVMYQLGTATEGVLRIPGLSTKIKAIVAAFNFNEDFDIDLFLSPNSLHSVGGGIILFPHL